MPDVLAYLEQSRVTITALRSALRVSHSDIISYSTLPRLLTVTTRGDPSQCSIIHGDMINHDFYNQLVLLTLVEIGIRFSLQIVADAIDTLNKLLRVFSSSRATLLILPATLLARRSINYYITGPLMLS